jgi:hypothetical protein
MTKPEITAFIIQNVNYTHTNHLFIWSDWWPFQPQNRKVLEEISNENQFDIEFSDHFFGIDKNNFRIKRLL